MFVAGIDGCRGGFHHRGQTRAILISLPLPRIPSEVNMQSEQSLSDLLIANAAKDAERHVAQLKFLEGEIKTLISAIRTAPDVESLRVVANDTVERLRKRSLEMEKARLRARQDEVARLPRTKEDKA